MELCLLDYLESKNFDAEQIIRFQKLYSNKNDAEVIKKMEAIYKIFNYACLADIYINDLILNNIKILNCSDLEIIKICYVWNQTGVLLDSYDKVSGINYNNISRTYLRNAYLNSGICYNKSPISYRVLTMGDKEFQNDYRGSLNNNLFLPSFENLVYIYGKGKTFEEKSENIDELLNTLSLKWYLTCIKKDNKKEKNNEAQGYGSI